MTNQKKQVEENGGVNRVVGAGIVAVVGAGIALAGAVALKDKNNRNKVKDVLTNAKDQAVERMEDLQKQSQDKTIEAGEKLDNGLEEVKKAKVTAKRQVRKAA